MDGVDASDHYEVSAVAETPALLTIVLDTNPRAWAALASTLPLSKAIANILVFANSHLALESTNQVAVIASHSDRAVWLYPSPKEVAATAAAAAAVTARARRAAAGANTGNGSGSGTGSPWNEDVAMTDADDGVAAHSNSHGHSHSNGKHPQPSANKFPQFREIETTLLKSVHDLVTSTTERDLEETTTLLSGALTLALAHINKTAILIPAAAAAAASASGKDAAASAATSAASNTGAGAGTRGAARAGNKTGANGAGGAPGTSSNDEVGLHARILVISVSDSSPAQYIPTMNAVFAAAHAGVAIDVLALRGAPTFLQQATYITRGTFLAADGSSPSSASAPASAAAGAAGGGGHGGPQGLLAYLMLGFSAASSREVAGAMVAPSADAVDFRAACFCHRRMVDTGFVCSICLSIFCEVPGAPDLAGAGPTSPPTTECLTCGSQLRLGNYGAKPAVVPRPKKKRKKRLAGIGGREETGSAVGTPMAS